ncbi:MAG: regulatory protein RecX [Anaerovoracaceae bacterium]
MDIRDRALNYLANRSRTAKEMVDHLKAKGFPMEEIEPTLEFLKDFSYIDDSDYCRQYFDYAFGKGRGIQRVKQELVNKGVDSQIIAIAIEDYESETTELQRAKKQAAKLIANGETVEDKLLAKMGRKLTALGYTTDVVYKVVGEYMRGEHD